jgi:hypothetical protein
MTYGLVSGMRLAISLALLSAAVGHAADAPFFTMVNGDSVGWSALLGSVGYVEGRAGGGRVFVARAGAPASVDWPGRVDKGALLVLEGGSPLAEMFGFRAGGERLRVTSAVDSHSPKLAIVWEHQIEISRCEIPAAAQVFTRERWRGTPLAAGLRRGQGGVLWLATAAGERGYERFPYLLQALCDLGLDPPFRSNRLWAFFDSSYRLRVDLDYFAARWRKSGISGLHVAAWHYFEPDPERDEYLRRLIAACHREGILVYAWLELPHVSEKFWAGHPEWREKTALLQDAQLDWRKLMNLENRQCFRAASAGVKDLARRFDWDGINLAELYFESLEGIANPSRFTPMNDDVRAAFRTKRGFDPIEIFGARNDEASRRLFLDFRGDLARTMQEEWIGELETLRREKPDLEFVLTHVDDRMDRGMRDAIGADAARALPLLERHAMTFMVEDPATIWNLGPERYAALASRYGALTTHRERLAIDLNIVDRYQDVYPTKQQTGGELLQLVSQASKGFARTALYFENSLMEPDLRLLPSAAAVVERFENTGDGVTVESRHGVGVAWKGGALVDGAAWPFLDGETVWVPGGAHRLQTSPLEAGMRVVRFTGELRAARVAKAGVIEFSYESGSRAIAVFDKAPVRVLVDGRDELAVFAGPKTALLPRGKHSVRVEGP